MIIVLLAAFGLILGSFVNALVWRVHKQLTSRDKGLSIVKGRSMCVHCKHELSAADLVPVLSWLMLGRKCRYCKKSISWQYPVVELTVSVLFVISYLFWPLNWEVAGVINFVVWLVMLTGFTALLVYDIKWMLLPNRIVYPLTVLALVLTAHNIFVADDVLHAFAYTVVSVLIAGGIFWGLFMVSKGKWIGGGDVKLGLLIGLLLADPYAAFFMMMSASLLGTVVVLPGMALRKLSTSSRVPFGPFLIIACVFVYLFGSSIIEWYKASLYFNV